MVPLVVCSCSSILFDVLIPADNHCHPFRGESFCCSVTELAVVRMKSSQPLAGGLSDVPSSYTAPSQNICDRGTNVDVVVAVATSSALHHLGAETIAHAPTADMTVEMFTGLVQAGDDQHDALRAGLEALSTEGRNGMWTVRMRDEIAFNVCGAEGILN